MLQNINSLIAKQIKYGFRKKTIAHSGYVLIWSNAYAKWDIYGWKRNKGETLNLDANQIFVPGSKKDIVAILDQLNPLPLYQNSFEYLFVNSSKI